jgi:peptide subunit release factor RF-3
MKNKEAIEKRRTFGIIAHPDAGKTTLTKWLTNKDTSFYSGIDLNKLNQYRNLN